MPPTPEEAADRYFMAADWIARQGELMAWLYLTDRKGAAVQMQVSVDAFLQQWPKSMRDDLLYAYHLAWSGKHREMES